MLLKNRTLNIYREDEKEYMQLFNLASLKYFPLRFLFFASLFGYLSSYWSMKLSLQSLEYGENTGTIINQFDGPK